MAEKDKKIRIDIELTAAEMKELKMLAVKDGRSKRWLARHFVLLGLKNKDKR